MQYFIDNLAEPRRISPMSAFMSPFQALAMMFNVPGMFIVAILSGLVCLLSSAIPFLAFFLIPMALGLVMAKTVSAIHGSSSGWQELNIWVYARLKLRVWIFALMILPPLLLIFGSIINLLQNYGEPGARNFSAVYCVIGAVFFSAIWGLVLFTANFQALNEKNGISVSCIRAISLLKANVIPMMVMLINWFMELAFFYFVIASAVIAGPHIFGSMGLLAVNIFNWGFLFIAGTFFLSHYLVTLGILGYQIYAAAADDSSTEDKAA